ASSSSGGGGGGGSDSGGGGSSGGGSSGGGGGSSSSAGSSSSSSHESVNYYFKFTLCNNTDIYFYKYLPKWATPPWPPSHGKWHGHCYDIEWLSWSPSSATILYGYPESCECSSSSSSSSSSS